MSLHPAALTADPKAKAEAIFLSIDNQNTWEKARKAVNTLRETVPDLDSELFSLKRLVTDQALQKALTQHCREKMTQESYTLLNSILTGYQLAGLYGISLSSFGNIKKSFTEKNPTDPVLNQTNSNLTLFNQANPNRLNGTIVNNREGDEEIQGLNKKRKV